MSVLLVVLVGLLWLFISVALADCPTWTKSYLGLTDKNEALKFLGISMGGVLLALQAVIANRRAKAMEKQANAQADSVEVQTQAVREQADANRATEQGRRQDRLKDAIDHLGHTSDSVRLGSAHELFQLAQDTPDSRVTVLSILCAHIRRTTGEGEYQKKYSSKPSEEIQTLLNLLFVQPHEVFKGLPIDLQGSWLNGADLRVARLEEAILTRVHLRSAHLESARLQGADFSRVVLQGAELWNASLQGASFWRASLQGAGLEYAEMQGANFLKAFLQGARLWRASLQEAELGGASLQGISCQFPPESDSFAGFIEARIDKATDPSEVIFAGGLSREDMDSFVGSLSDEKAKELRAKLEPHIDQPASNELPENSGAITGAYTAEEAEQWIAEYNKAMSEVPAESDN